jgi:hypothetical protein
MPPGRTKEREIPGKKCFDYWMDLKSITKVSLKLASEGFVNQQTGHAYNYTSVYNAALRYMREHMAETRKILIDFGYEFAIDEKQWRDYMVRKAWTYWTTNPYKFVSWMDEQGWDVEDFGYIFPIDLPGIRKYVEQYNITKSKG